VLLQDKNNAIAKQANKLVLRKTLSFENKQNEMLVQLMCKSGRRDGKKEAKWKEQTAELYRQC